MGIFSTLETNNVERSGDVIGGAPTILPSNIYIMTIKALFEVPGTTGARRIDLIAETENHIEYKESFYITTREGKPFYIRKDSEKKVFLPGYETVNDICLIANNEELADVETENKVFNLFDWDLKKEIPKSVPTITSVIGKQIALAISHELRNKTEKQDDKYVETAETVERNAIVKVMHPQTHQTVSEALAKKEATFWDKWLKQNEGKKLDKRKIKSSEKPEVKKEAPKPEPKKSLFS